MVDEKGRGKKGEESVATTGREERMVMRRMEARKEDG
jgi:hypothetical protein